MRTDISRSWALLTGAAEDLLARKRAGDEQGAAVLEWAKAQPRSWLAAELGCDLSNLGKVLAQNLRPKRVLAKIQDLKNRADANSRLSRPSEGR